MTIQNCKSLGMLNELDADLLVMRASKYRFGSEDPFPLADLAPARTVEGVASATPLYAAWQYFQWKDPNGEKRSLPSAQGGCSTRRSRRRAPAAASGRNGWTPYARWRRPG